MNKEKLAELFEYGGTLVILDMPPKTEFGIDMESWQVGEKFKGIKMIPPGLHYVYYSATSKDGQTAPRTGFFHVFDQKEVVVKNYCKITEDITDETNLEQIERIKQNLRSFDGNLGPYPYDSWSKWVSFSQHIKREDLLRLQPLSGKVSSVPELVNKQKRKLSNDEVLSSQSGSKISKPEKEVRQLNVLDNENSSRLQDLSKLLPDMEPKHGTGLRFSTFPDKPHRIGATPLEITKGNIDSSFTVESVVSKLEQPQSVLGELQFTFICFLVGQVWDGWEHWKKMIIALCRAEDFLINNPQLYLQFLSIIHYQIEEVPEDLFADIVEGNNFLVVSLTNLFANIDDNASVLPTSLVNRSHRFRDHLISKFHWNLSLVEEGEDAPIIVDLEPKILTAD